MYVGNRSNLEDTKATGTSTRKYSVPLATARSAKWPQQPSIVEGTPLYMSLNDEIHAVTAGRDMPNYTSPVAVERSQKRFLTLPVPPASNKMMPSPHTMRGAQGLGVKVVNKSEPLRYEIPLASINKVDAPCVA